MSATGVSSNPRRGQPPVRWAAEHATVTTAAIFRLDVVCPVCSLRKKIAAVTVVVCGSRRLALRLTAITSPSSGSIVAGRSRWRCSSSEGVEGWEEEWLNENGKRKKNEWTKNRGFFVAPLQLAMCIRQGPPPHCPLISDRLRGCLSLREGLHGKARPRYKARSPQCVCSVHKMAA